MKPKLAFKWFMIIPSVVSVALAWGVPAIFTNWYNERQSDGIQTLSVAHALLFLVLQGVAFFATLALMKWHWEEEL